MSQGSGLRLRPSSVFRLRPLLATSSFYNSRDERTKYPPPHKMVTRTKKIFVGGLSANTVVEDVKQYFEQFGK
ncbi:unnamed protein product, partial [Pleuronectes platessa]